MTYGIALETALELKRLNLPEMSLRAAREHCNTLRALSPSQAFHVINLATLRA